MAWSSFYDSFFLFFRRLGILFAANILWILFSLPIITLPAATGALYYLVERVLSEEHDPESYPAYVGDFWKGLRLYWLQSTLFMLVNGIIFTVLISTGIFYWQNPSEWLNWLIGPLALITFGFLAMNIYLWPLRQIYRDDSIWNIYRRAVRLVLTYPFDSFLLLLWLILLAVLFVAMAGPTMLLLFSLLAVIQSYMLRKIRVRRGEIVDVDLDELKRS